MYILRNKASSITIPVSPPGSTVSTYTLENATITGDTRLGVIDGAPGTLLLSPNANYSLQGSWVIGAGANSAFQHNGLFSASVWVNSSGVATLSNYVKYNESFAGLMELTVPFNNDTKRPEIVLRSFIWGGTVVTRSLVSLTVLEIARNSQI